MRYFLRCLLVYLLVCCFPVAAHAVDESRLQLPANETDLQYAREADNAAKQNRWADARTHANRAKDPAIAALYAWMQYNDRKGGGSFTEITQFLATNPGWPNPEALAKAAEDGLSENTPDKNILAWYATTDEQTGARTYRTPLTAKGQYFLAMALLGQGKSLENHPQRAIIQSLIRQAWEDYDFENAESEKNFRERFAQILRKEDHAARISSLLWQGKVAAAERIMHLVSADYRTLFIARIKLQRDRFGIDEVVNSVPAALRNDEGFVYDRILWLKRNRRATDESVIKLFMQASKSKKYPTKWWKLKADYVDNLMDEQRYRDAYSVASRHGFEDEATKEMADAEWISGWLAFRYLKDYKSAYKHFYQLHANAKTPVTLGRAAYWAGRAAEANQNNQIAEKWYEVGSKYPTSFYGQLAANKLGHTHLDLPSIPEPQDQDYRDYRNNPQMRAVDVLRRIGNHTAAKTILKYIAQYNDSPTQQKLIADYGLAVDRKDYAVQAARAAALEGGPIILEALYPTIPLVSLDGKRITTPEPALLHALILQESNFNVSAHSPVGAMGLTQIMPGTGKDIARWLGVGYSAERLMRDPKYNVTFGAAYLQRRIENFYGSYIMAVAAYNGGAGNVHKWKKRFGDPRQMKTPEQVVDWIEQIPFPETQGYIHRLIENLQIYRYVLNPTNGPRVQTAKDIMRYVPE